VAESEVQSAIVVATGADRPGILDELSQFLLECGGNVVDMRSINLHGQFALLLHISVPAGAVQAIRAGLPMLSANGIAAELRPAEAQSRDQAATFPYTLTVTGKDQIGVLHRISHLLRVLKINIEDVETHVARDRSFEIRLTLAIPRESPITMVRDYLNFLCKELNITGELKEA
jgi:glycine cleavage system transcriptional repressor